MPDTRHTLPARFDRDAWDEDLARASGVGRAAAQTARHGYELSGVPLDELRQVQEEGPDGTVLPQCLKVYLPRPAGRYGMVFEVVRTARGLGLEYIAFGVRHHPGRSHAPTVYQLAHRRLAQSGMAQQLLDDRSREPR